MTVTQHGKLGIGWKTCLQSSKTAKRPTLHAKGRMPSNFHAKIVTLNNFDATVKWSGGGALKGPAPSATAAAHSHFEPPARAPACGRRPAQVAGPRNR